MWAVKLQALYGQNESESWREICVIFDQTDSTFAHIETAVTTNMFYNDDVFNIIHTACETQVAAMVERYNCKFT